ncbi:MAG: hypothetical protein KVP17_003764 [Porospora cf. gigantea B]|uniref:uncharacterized protein n=1 Tax=Porospora cf. gigantea B TaxID=2853592 RepID=UPI003571D4D1|nr:MAG: hypothetical protein KVP17_003764 [Porospora cf. gigantea B]
MLPTRRVIAKRVEGCIDVIDIEETLPVTQADGTSVIEVRLIRQRVTRPCKRSNAFQLLKARVESELQQLSDDEESIINVKVAAPLVQLKGALKQTGRPSKSQAFESELVSCVVCFSPHDKPATLFSKAHKRSNPNAYQPAGRSIAEERAAAKNARVLKRQQQASPVIHCEPEQPLQPPTQAWTEPPTHPTIRSPASPSIRSPTSPTIRSLASPTIRSPVSRPLEPVGLQSPHTVSPRCRRYSWHDNGSPYATEGRRFSWANGHSPVQATRNPDGGTAMHPERVNRRSSWSDAHNQARLVSVAVPGEASRRLFMG